MSNPLNSIPISLTAPRFIGKHKDCGGSVYYHSGASCGFRRCNKCCADGRNGTASPDVENI